VLKPGGRLAVSDIALKKPLPPEIGQDLMAYVGCIAGAIPIEEYRHGLAEPVSLTSRSSIRVPI
jgi:arsenite methyltransferase